MQQAHDDAEHRSLSCAQAKPCSGFTMVELIITIAVLAIIALMAAPSFASIYNRQKLESSVRELAMKVSEARSQAVMTRQVAGLCLVEWSSEKDDKDREKCAIKLSTSINNTFLVYMEPSVTANTSSSFVTSLRFRTNGSIAAQKDFMLERQGLSYCVRVGVIGDTIITEGACP
ncbi:GspH/FimT family pseudopilin [Acinetobacter sp. WC-323]|uniref:GspH/FimT family pseudopilin n=1 Tax=Acinetobacter sp. WC-323 TaxID=903918 RepID=UPI000517FC48|nr:GspH/FimT family pseudopilin [Acinetobacter sp. WC-323]